MCLSWLYHHILSVVSYTRRENWVFVSITLPSMMCANNWIHLGLKVILVCLHIALSNGLSLLCWQIWKHWIYKMHVRYILSSVCLRLRPFSQLFLCNISCWIFSAYAFLFRWLWEKFVLHFIIIITSEIWISHRLGLGHCTMRYTYEVICVSRRTRQQQRDQRVVDLPTSLEHCLLNGCNTICMLRNIFFNIHSL